MNDEYKAVVIVFCAVLLFGIAAITAATIKTRPAPTCPPDTFAVSTPDGDYECITDAVVAAEKEPT